MRTSGTSSALATSFTPAISPTKLATRSIALGLADCSAPAVLSLKCGLPGLCLVRVMPPVVRPKELPFDKPFVVSLPYVTLRPFKDEDVRMVAVSAFHT